MKINLATIDLQIVKVKDWDKKKQKLLDLVDFDDPECIFDSYFSDFFMSQATWNTGKHPYVREFFKILEWEPEKHFNYKTHCTGLWCQRYQHRDSMGVHHHEQGISAVLYAQFDSNRNWGTTFISPFRTIWDNQVTELTPEVEEGDILLFPSQLLHYVKCPASLYDARPTDPDRIIFSFNINQEGMH